MDIRQLGNTGITVSEIGFGAWAIGGNAYGNSYGPTDDTTSIRAVRTALDLGCTFFDTADVYGHGHSEHLLGAALGAQRRDVVVATKVGGDFYGALPRLNFSAGYIRTALEQSLARLATDYIDIYQLHNPPMNVLRDGVLLDLLSSLKKEGKIRAAGISIFEPEEGMAAMRSYDFGAIQVVFNVFDSRAADKLLPMAKRNGIGIIAREPLGNGFLSGKYREDCRFPEGDIRSGWPREYIEVKVKAARRFAELISGQEMTPAQLALRYALSREEVSVAIPGIKTPEQARENLAASEMGPLSSELLRGIRLLQRRDFGV